MSTAGPISHDFTALFAEHSPFVWRVLRRHGVPERELEDGCQDVFMVVHRRLADFEGRSSVRTWIYAIAVRVALSTRRKARFTRERLDDDVPEQRFEATQQEGSEKRQSLALIMSALAALPDAKREVFVLYELEGMTMAEAANALGIPENTALSRLYAAREDIRALMERDARTAQRTRELAMGRAAP